MSAATSKAKRASSINNENSEQSSISYKNYQTMDIN